MPVDRPDTPGPLREQVISAERRSRPAIGAIRQTLAELPGLLSLSWVMAKRDLQAEHSTSWLGYAWLILEPMVFTVIFVFVRNALARRGFVVDTGDVPPALFAVIGIIVFQAWMSGLILQLNGIRANMSLVRGMNWPLETFFLSGLMRGLIDMAIRLALIAAALIIFGHRPGPWALLFPFAAILIAANGHFIGFILSPIGALINDLRNLVRMLSLLIMLASGVFFALPEKAWGLMHLAIVVNPLATGLDCARDLLFGGSFTYWVPAFVGFAVFAGVAVLMFFAMRAVRGILAERLQ